MGITKLFSFGADISGIKCTEGESTNQSVKVFHQSTIEVDEEGTEAAASTGIVFYLFIFETFSLTTVDISCRNRPTNFSGIESLTTSRIPR